MTKAIIKIEKSKMKARRNYKVELEFNSDRVLSKRELDLLLDIISDAIQSPKDVNEQGNFVSASYKTVVLNKSVEYRKPLNANGEEE